MTPLPLSIMRDAWYFFTRHLGAIALLCLPLIMLECVARQLVVTWAKPETAAVYDVMVGLLFYPLYTAALILFLDARSRGLQPRRRDLLAQAAALWPSFALLAGLSSLLIMLGVSLLVLPGVWVMVKLAFAEYLLVLHGLTPVAALRASLQQTRGHFWSILFCVLTVIVPLMILDGWSASMAGEVTGLMTFILDCANSFLMLFATVLLFRLYMQVSSTQPGVE